MCLRDLERYLVVFLWIIDDDCGKLWDVPNEEKFVKKNQWEAGNFRKGLAFIEKRIV